MSYKAKINNETFFDTNLDSEKYKLTSAQVNGLKSFTFTVPVKNAFHGKFEELKDYVEVYKGEKQIFAGRVYSLQEGLERSQKVVCEHISVLLNDSVHRAVTYEGMTNREVFTSLIENHNSMVNDAKKLIIGRITVTAASCYRSYEKIEKTSKRINDLIDSFGGHLAFRREYTEAGTKTYIDWLKEYDEGCNQTIRLGRNILDIKKESNSYNVITALIPYGAEDDDGNRLDIKSVNGGKDYITAPQSVQDEHGGLIFDTVTFEDVTVASNLLAKAQQYLKDAYTGKITINVTAVDLADAGYDVESFHVGQSIHAISEPHGIDGWFDCTDQKLDLLNPANNKLTLGNTVTGHIETQRKQIEAIRAEADQQKTALQKAIERNSGLITGNKGGYVVVHDSDQDGHPDEILIMDTPSIETARKVWRWNKSGLGYSSTGYEGEYGLAMTIDGEIVANYIMSGALNANIVKTGILRSQKGGTYWNIDTGEFHFGADVTTDSAQIFVAQPTTPYRVGDLYVTGRIDHTAVVGRAVVGRAVVGVSGTYGIGGDIYVCTTAREKGSDNADDWKLVTNYADTLDLKSLYGKINRAEIEIKTNANGIRSKVSLKDYNGETIASIINQSADSVSIDAKHINLNGIIALNDVLKVDSEGVYTDDMIIKAANRSEHVYTQADYERVRDIVMGDIHPTQDDYDKYALTNDGSITSLDYIKIRNCVQNYGGVYSTSIEIQPNSLKDVIVVRNNLGNETRISAGNIRTNNINFTGALYRNGEKLGYVEEIGEIRVAGQLWKYRKWTDGYYECWTSVERENFRIGTEWGTIYEGVIGSFEYPIIFTETPNLQVAVNWGDYGWMLETKNNTYTRQTTPTYYAVSAVERTMKIGMSIFASGYRSMTPDM